MNGKLGHEREERNKTYRCYHDRPHPAWVTVRGALAPAGRPWIAGLRHIAGIGCGARGHRALALAGCGLGDVRLRERLGA